MSRKYSNAQPDNIEISTEVLSTVFYGKCREVAGRIGGDDFKQDYVDGVEITRSTLERVSRCETMYSFSASKERDDPQELAERTVYMAAVRIEEPLQTFPDTLFEPESMEHSDLKGAVAAGAAMLSVLTRRFVIDSVARSLIVADELTIIIDDEEFDPADPDMGDESDCEPWAVVQEEENTPEAAELTSLQTSFNADRLPDARSIDNIFRQLGHGGLTLVIPKS